MGWGTGWQPGSLLPFLGEHFLEPLKNIVPSAGGGRRRTQGMSVLASHGGRPRTVCPDSAGRALSEKLNSIINFEIINFLPGQVKRAAGIRTQV